MKIQATDRYGVTHAFAGPDPRNYEGSSAGRWVGALLDMFSRGYIERAEVQRIINCIFEDC